MSLPEGFVEFLLRAKRSTYAAGVHASASSRPASQDLPYQEGDFFYLDSYLGGLRFAGEEAVWHAGQPVWAMNYYGWMLADEIPEGFSPFLKEALLLVPPEAPYRGPRLHQSGSYTFRCQRSGALQQFSGQEWIDFCGQPIYTLLFHGGSLR